MVTGLLEHALLQRVVDDVLATTSSRGSENERMAVIGTVRTASHASALSVCRVRRPLPTLDDGRRAAIRLE